MAEQTKRRADEHEVVEQRREQATVEDREDLPVVLEPDELDRGQRREVVPRRERQGDGDSAGIHTSTMCRNAGIPIIRPSHTRSRPATAGSVAGGAPSGRAGARPVVSDVSSHSKVYVPFCSSTVTGSCRCCPDRRGSRRGPRRRRWRRSPGRCRGRGTGRSTPPPRRARRTSPAAACSRRSPRRLGGDDGRVDGDVRVDRRGTTHGGQQRLGAVDVGRLGGEHEAVDRRLDGILAVLLGDRREGEEVDVVDDVLLRVGLEVAGDERADQHHPDLVVPTAVAASCHVRPATSGWW